MRGPRNLRYITCCPVLGLLESGCIHKQMPVGCLLDEGESSHSLRGSERAEVGAGLERNRE